MDFVLKLVCSDGEYTFATRPGLPLGECELDDGMLGITSLENRDVLGAVTLTAI